MVPELKHQAEAPEREAKDKHKQAWEGKISVCECDSVDVLQEPLLISLPCVSSKCRHIRGLWQEEELTAFQ